MANFHSIHFSYRVAFLGLCVIRMRCLFAGTVFLWSVEGLVLRFLKVQTVGFQAHLTIPPKLTTNGCGGRATLDPFSHLPKSNCLVFVNNGLWRERERCWPVRQIQSYAVLRSWYCELDGSSSLTIRRRARNPVGVSLILFPAPTFQDSSPI